MAVRSSAVTVYCMYLRLNLSTTPDFRILDKITQTAKPIRIIGDPENQLSDKLSSTVII